MAENLPPTSLQEPVEMLDNKTATLGAEESAKAPLEEAAGTDNLEKPESGEESGSPVAPEKEPVALPPQVDESDNAVASQRQDAPVEVKEEVKTPLTTVPVAVNLGDDFLAPKPAAGISAPDKAKHSSGLTNPEPSAPATMALEASKESPGLQTGTPDQPSSLPPPAEQQTPQLQMLLPSPAATKPEMPPPSQAPSQVHQPSQILALPTHTHTAHGPVAQSPQQQSLRLGLGTQVMSPYQSSMPPPGTHLSPAPQQMPLHQQHQQQQQHVTHYHQQPQHYQQHQPHMMQPQHQSPMMHHQPHMTHQTPPMPPQVQPMQHSPMLSAHSQHVPQQQMMHSPQMQVMMPHPGASPPTQQLMPQQPHMIQGYQHQHGTPYMVGMPAANSPPRTMMIQQPAGMVSPGFGPGDFGSWAPFTTAQWQELEQQAMVFKYLVAGAPVPQELVDSMRASLAQAMAHGRIVSFGQSLWGAQVDPEPYRCRRTDGKKWRCSREVVPDQKYCERHMHRGRNRARKTSDKSTPGTSLVSADESADPVHKSASQGGSELLSDDGARLDRSESMAGTLSSGGPPPLALPPSAHAVASDGPGPNQQAGTGPHVHQRPQTGPHTQHQGHQAQLPQQQQQQQRSLQLFPSSTGGSAQSAGATGAYQPAQSQQYMQSSQYQQHSMGGPGQTTAPGQYQQTGYGQNAMHAPSHTYTQNPQQQHYPMSNQQSNSGYGQQYQSATYSSQQPMPQQQVVPGGAPYSAQNPSNGTSVPTGPYQMSQNNRSLAPNGQGPQGPTYTNQQQYTTQGYTQQTGYAQPYSQQQGQGTYSSGPSQHGPQSQSYGQPQYQQGAGTYISAQHPQGPSHMSHQNTGKPLVRSESQYSSQSSYVHAGDAQQQHYYVQQGHAHPGSQAHSMGATTYSGTGQMGTHMQGAQGGYSSGAPSPPASQMSEVQHFQAQQQQPGAAPTSSGLVATSSTGDKVPLLRVPSILQVERSSGSSITYDQPPMALCM